MTDIVKKLGYAVKKDTVIVEKSITGTGSFTATDHGLSSVDHAVVCVKNSGSAIPTHTASITSISGTTINVVVTEHQASANAVATAAKTVVAYIVGTK